MFDTSNVIAAFTEDQVCRLTGLTKAQLRYWARTGFFAPAHAEQAHGQPYARLYSFRDVVALRTLAMLRVQNGVPLQHLRKVAERLSRYSDQVWTGITLYVLNRKVVFEEPGTGKPQEVVSGQYVIGIPLRRVVEDTARDAEDMRRRPEELQGQVSRRRGVLHNQPVVAGTRILVSSIVRLHEDGYSVDDIIREYPDLTRDDVEAALRYGRGKAAA